MKLILTFLVTLVFVIFCIFLLNILGIEYSGASFFVGWIGCMVYDAVKEWYELTHK